MYQFLIIAIRNVAKHKTRSLMLGGAIAAVTALMVVLMSLTNGIHSTIFETATALATGHLNIGGYYKLSQSSAAPVVTKYKPVEEIVRKHVPEATLVINRIRCFGKLISDTTSIMVPMFGVDMKTEQETIGRLAMAEKNEYIENYAYKDGENKTEGNLAELNSQRSIVLFASHAKKLKVKVGDTLTVSMPTYRNISNTKDVKIAAILRDVGMMSSFTVFINHNDARDLYQLAPDSTGVVMIFLKSTSTMKRIEERLRTILSEKKYELMEKDSQPFWMKFDRISGESWTGQKLDVTTWEDETSFIKWILDIFYTITFIMTAVLMTIIVIGLVNNLWISIRERTSEIGTLRAIGTQRRQVTLMFVLEASVLSITATALGIGAGVLISVFLDALQITLPQGALRMFLMSNNLNLKVNFGAITICFLVITVFLTLGSVFPARRAGKVKPITAINQVE